MSYYFANRNFPSRKNDYKVVYYRKGKRIFTMKYVHSIQKSNKWVYWNIGYFDFMSIYNRREDYLLGHYNLKTQKWLL